MIPKPIESITYDDIEALVTQQVQEARSIEFKREAVGQRDEDKREFLADVSSFANTIGGDLIFGIAENNSVASEVTPLTLQSIDAEIRRLEDILRSGLEPRLPACEMKWLAKDQHKGVLLIRIPRSWAAPHRVIFRDHSKFYARDSARKSALDVTQLRAAFNASETLIERIKAFRRERLNVIDSNEGPVPLREGAKLIFHILPLSAFTNPTTVSRSDNAYFPPLGATGFNELHTLEGLAYYSGPEDATDNARAYTLSFRNGIVEAVAHVGYRGEREAVVIVSTIEVGLLGRTHEFFSSLRKVGVEPPFYVALSLVGVRGHTLARDTSRYSRVERPLRRDVLILPETLCNDVDPDVMTLLQPSFDMLWQAFSYSQAFSFSADGRYVGER